MKENIKNYLLLIVQHKNFYYFLSFLLSGAVIYYGYTYYIKQNYENVQAVKLNIGKFKEKQLKENIKNLKKEKSGFKVEYNKLLKDKYKSEESMYKEVYDVVVDVINKLNSSSFNIYKYGLNDEYNEIDLEMNGSYLNLIKLFDYLQTIKANVVIVSYSVELVDDKMLIKMKLKVGILKI